MSREDRLAAGIDNDAADSAQKQRRGRFQSGASGNPKGRPHGSRNRATLALEAILEGEGERITRRVIDLALAGNKVALRLCFEQLIPLRHDHPIRAELAELSTATNTSAKLDAIFAAVADGRLPPYEGEKLTNLLMAQLKAKQGEELEQRVAELQQRFSALEQQLKSIDEPAA